MPSPTPEEYRKSVEIEDEVMSRLRTVYHSLKEVSTIVASHREILRRCGSPLADQATGCPPVEEAWAIIEEIARSPSQWSSFRWEGQVDCTGLQELRFLLS